MRFALAAAAVAALLGAVGIGSATAAPHHNADPELCLLDPDACT
jgi:hypothetical protein